MIERESEDGAKLYAPVYVFKDQQGQEVKIISSSASWPPVGEIGDPLEVLYLPKDPTQSIPNRFFSKWGFCVIPSALGFFYLIVFGLVAYLTGRHLKKKANKAEQATPNSAPVL